MDESRPEQQAGMPPPARDCTGARRGVLLIAMGGPRGPGEVEPFLRALFSDRDLIRLPVPAFLQPLLARWMARRRAPRAAGRYALIGGRSPLPERIETQAAQLENMLAGEGGQWTVRAAFRYSHPSVADGVAALRDAGVEEIVALPMYPQRSGTTTGSALNEFDRVRQRIAPGLPARRARLFLDTPDYLDALAERIRAHRERVGLRAPGSIHLLFVAHSLPEKLIRDGDPYLDDVHETIHGLDRRLGLEKSTLGWQGQVGPMKWLGPRLDRVFEDLYGEGVRRVLVVPVSFLCDHVETLVELDVEARARAEALGFTTFERVRMFDGGEDLTRVLAVLVRGGA